MSSKSTAEIESMMDKLEGAKLLRHEATAFNYLIEPLYENLPFEDSHEGDRLYGLCVEVLESAITRLKL